MKLPVGATRANTSLLLLEAAALLAALGLDSDLRSSLLVFSVFRRGLKVQTASAAASRSRLMASALQSVNILGVSGIKVMPLETLC